MPDSRDLFHEVPASRVVAETQLDAIVERKQDEKKAKLGTRPG